MRIAQRILTEVNLKCVASFGRRINSAPKSIKVEDILSWTGILINQSTAAESEKETKDSG